MKRDNKKALYESIISSIAKQVKKVLNEELDKSEYDKIPEDAGFADKNGEVHTYVGKPEYRQYEYFGDCINTVDVDEMWNATQMAQVIRESEVLDDITWVLPKLINGDRKIPGKLKQKLYDLQRFKNLNQIHDMEEIVAAINEEQKILVIYVSDFDTHFFFDCCR